MRGGVPAIAAPRSGRLIVALCIALVAVVTVTEPAWPLAGALDTTFDGDGVVVTPVADGSTGEDVLVQPDGRIVVVGWSVQPDGLPPQPPSSDTSPGVGPTRASGLTGSPRRWLGSSAASSTG
jgi:hypothetical protein